jgi:hypothetical protein
MRAERKARCLLGPLVPNHWQSRVGIRVELCPRGRCPRGISYSLARCVDAQARSALSSHTQEPAPTFGCFSSVIQALLDEVSGRLVSWRGVGCDLLTHARVPMLPKRWLVAWHARRRGVRKDLEETLDPHASAHRGSASLVGDGQSARSYAHPWALVAGSFQGLYRGRR